MHHFFSYEHPLNLYQRKNTAVNKSQLHFSKEGRLLPYSGIGKPLYDKPTTLKVQHDNNCYFHGIVYLLKVSQDQHFGFRHSVCDYIAGEKYQMPTVIHQSCIREWEGLHLKDQIQKKYME